MRMSSLACRCLHVIALTVLVGQGWSGPLARSPADRLRTIMEGPGEPQARDVAFLKDHIRELLSFAESFFEKAGLGKRQEAPERTPLARPTRMLAAARDVPTNMLNEDIARRLVEIAARSDSGSGEALCKCLLRADDFVIARIGMEVSATRYPDFVVEALERQEIKKLFQREAIVILARADVKNALPVLRVIAEDAAGSKLAAIARLAVLKIEGTKAPEQFDKSTPEKLARSYVSLRESHPERYVEEDTEFYGNPMFEPYAKKWKEYLSSASEDKKKKNLARSLEVAKWLKQALKEPKKSLVVQGRECIVLVEGEEVIRLYQDMFGQWRFTPMP
ncbi:hypothetical protein HQ563_06920 [bacterium]|nr:hypothetical protein [bacterium]